MSDKETIQEAYILSDVELRFIKTFCEWLPDEIIDCHAHCGLDEHSFGLSEVMRKHVGVTFTGYDLSWSLKFQKLFYPNKDVRALRMPFPIFGIDIKAANDYLLEKSSSNDRVAACGLQSDPTYTIGLLEKDGVAALKMYSALADPPGQRIYDVFTPVILEEVQHRGLPIILHTPTPVNLCWDEFTNLMKDFPQLKVILAHFGKPDISRNNIDTIYKKLSGYPNIFMDTSLLANPVVIKSAFSFFDPARIMFGSDEPINLIRGTQYVHPKLGLRIAARSPYPWVKEEEFKEYGHLAKDAPHMHWLALDSLRSVIGKFKPAVLEKIFCKTAKELFAF